MPAATTTRLVVGLAGLDASRMQSCVVSIPATALTIGDLVTHLCSALSVPTPHGGVELTLRTSLVVASEPVGILRDDERVELVRRSGGGSGTGKQPVAAMRRAADHSDSDDSSSTDSDREAPAIAAATAASAAAAAPHKPTRRGKRGGKKHHPAAASVVPPAATGAATTTTAAATTNGNGGQPPPRKRARQEPAHPSASFARAPAHSSAPSAAGGRVPPPTTLDISMPFLAMGPAPAGASGDFSLPDIGDVLRFSILDLVDGVPDVSAPRMAHVVAVDASGGTVRLRGVTAGRAGVGAVTGGHEDIEWQSVVGAEVMQRRSHKAGGKAPSAAPAAAAAASSSKAAIQYSPHASLTGFAAGSSQQRQWYAAASAADGGGAEMHYTPTSPPLPIRGAVDAPLGTGGGSVSALQLPEPACVEAAVVAAVTAAAGTATTAPAAAAGSGRSATRRVMGIGGALAALRQ